MPITSASMLERRLELLVVVDLDEAVEVELARLGVELLELVAARARDDQQHRVGAVGRRLVELVAVDDEVLAQDRQAGGRARRAQVVERAAEVRLLGQDRERRRAAALVGARRPRATSAPGADVAGARRAALELGDQREPGPGQRLVERPRRPRARRDARSSCGERRPARGAARRPRGRRRRARRAWLMRQASAGAAPGFDHEPLAAIAARGARVDRLARASSIAASRSVGPAADEERRAGVEQPRDRARGPCSPARTARDDRRVLLRRAAGDRLQRRALEPELLGRRTTSLGARRRRPRSPASRPRSLISSMPSSPETTSARSAAEPRAAPRRSSPGRRGRTRRSAGAWRRPGWSAGRGS